MPKFLPPPHKTLSLCFGFHFAHFQKEVILKSEAQDDVNSHVRLSYAAVVSKSSREEEGIFVTSQPYVNGMQLGGLTYPRARGGAGGAPKMVDLCIRSAYRMGIFLQQGTPNPAAGNCLFESAIYNINDRPEFRPYTLESLSVQECRALWVTLLQAQIPVYRPEFDAYSDDDWSAMARDGTWDENLGDLMPYAISLGTRKRIIIWHSNPNPNIVSIVEPETFGSTIDSEIPICLAYSGSHYESMHPLNVEETVKLFESIKNGTGPLSQTDTKTAESYLLPFSPAEKMKRSRALKKMDIPVTPKKTMTVAEKRQKDTEYRRQYRQDKPDQRQKERQYAQTKRQKTLIQQIDSDTSFESICCVCREFKSRDKTSNIADTLSLGQIKKFCYRTQMTKEVHGTYSICIECTKNIKASKIPPKSQRDLFQFSSFPSTFLTSLADKINSSKTSLNKVEQFLLKLIIPFIRVAHCERGPQPKIRGNLILISSNLGKSLSKILPQSQIIIPVRFKRRLAYTGHYLAEYVDRQKVELYFDWFKKKQSLIQGFSPGQGPCVQI